MSLADAPAPNQNAVRHGLTADHPLDLDESRRLAELTCGWAIKLGVADMAERQVAHRIALSILKLERCEAADRAAEGPNVGAAARRWNRRRRHSIPRKCPGAGGRPRRHRRRTGGLGLRLRLAAPQVGRAEGDGRRRPRC